MSRIQYLQRIAARIGFREFDNYLQNYNIGATPPEGRARFFYSAIEAIKATEPAAVALHLAQASEIAAQDMVRDAGDSWTVDRAEADKIYNAELAAQRQDLLEMLGQLCPLRKI